MENKIQSNLDGRVGGVLPPYRDHHIIEITPITGGLDTPFAVAQGYSTTEGNL